MYNVLGKHLRKYTPIDPASQNMDYGKITGSREPNRLRNTHRQFTQKTTK